MKIASTLKRAAALLLALAICLTIPLAASAATVEEATIDTTKKGSLTIYKYDVTSAEKDGVWDSSYNSTGVYDQNVNDTLGSTDRESVLGNEDTTYGYAIQGVEFSYLKVADIVQFTESTKDNVTYDHVEVLYAIDKTVGADFLAAIGLEDGAKRYENADHLDSTKYYYQSDVLIDALAAALEANSTTVKNALEPYVKENGSSMELTDENGMTGAAELDLGLYLVAETAVPEMVVSTTNPFLVSLPMTSVNGTNATDGGTRWIYDVTVYPKNLTGIPSLTKELRENKNDTGKNGGSVTDIEDGFASVGTASSGDVIDYQIISTLPSITSAATYLSTYTFIDTLSAGLTYNQEDVVLAFYTDEACTDLITTWTEADGKFSVTYGTTDAGESTMTIEMTETGLTEINTADTVYTEDGMVNAGYSDCTLRITYAATMDSDNSVVFGDNGNPNEVVLMWQRSSSAYYDTLVDDAHVYTYGIELTKLFSAGNGDFSKVEFMIYNETDGYFVKAELNEDEGVYYVVDHVAAEADGTHFIPVENDQNEGIIMVKGLEDDKYIITEVQTANGYVLLKDDVVVTISTAATTEICDIYETDVLGLVQNDARYTEEIINEAVENGYIKTTGGLADILNNMPQTHLEHTLLTASADVDGNAVVMLSDNGSTNAEAPLTVTNDRGFNLPETGDVGIFIISSAGMFALVVLVTLSVIGLANKKKENQAA